MKSLEQLSISRGAKCIRCFPFNQHFYSEAQKKGLDAYSVYKKSDLYKNQLIPWFRNEYLVESSFRRMIKVGVMRREVDGQGLTSKVRLTPLGRTILENYPFLLYRKPLAHELICNWLYLNNPFT